ncbi:unnamed protein product [Caenorhabditis brenneri]
MPDEEETSRLAWTKRLSRRLNKRSSSLIASLLGSRNGATSSKTINEPTTTEDELDEESMEEVKRREIMAARRASAAPNVENRVGSRSGGKEKSTSRRRSVDRIWAYKVKVSLLSAGKLEREETRLETLFGIYPDYSCIWVFVLSDKLSLKFSGMKKRNIPNH